MFSPLFGCVGDPVKHRLVHDTLLRHAEVVSAQEVSELLRRQALELLAGHNLLEVVGDEGEGRLLQLGEDADVAESPDADAVLRVEPLLQEAAADSYDAHDVELIGRQQQLLNVFLRHCHQAGVGKVQDEPHHVGGQARDVVHLLA